MIPTKEHKESLEFLEFADKTEKSIRDFINWILAISLGCFTLLIFKADQIENEIGYLKITYKAIVGLSMFAIFISGLTKYHIMRRETRLSRIYSSLLKIISLNSFSPTTKFEKEQKELYDEWYEEFNKIILMTQFLNVSIIITGIQVLIFGIFILIIV